MIAHLVLFRLRPDVSASERHALIDAYAVALREIPTIRRTQIGRRVVVGRPYEQMAHPDLPYGAVLEFDNLAGLEAYLDHPAHGEIATRFFAAVAESLVYDFEMEPSADGLRGMI